MGQATLVIILSLGVLLVGRGEEQAGQDGGTTVVERTVVETVEVTKEQTVPTEATSGYVPLDPEEQREADAAKATAANEEITLETLNEIDTSTTYGEQLVLGLFSCQLEKYAADYGQAAAEEFAVRGIEEAVTTPAEGEEIVSLQEEFIEMGYSCTVPEARGY